MSAVDVLIVGSGFGGAVMAARIGAWARASGKKLRIVVLERGDDPTSAFDPRSGGPPINAQGNRFRHSFDPKSVARITDLYNDLAAGSVSAQGGTPTMNVVAGRGLGGGSNVYDAVSLRAPATSFEQVRDGRRLWPSIYTRAALEPYYAAVEARLAVHRLAWSDASAPHWQLATKRDFVFAEGCRKIGATAAPLKVATNRDRNEGWWNQGQRFEGRQDLTKNYLLDAKTAGVETWTGCDVRTVAPTKGGYVVTGIDRRGGLDLPFEVEARIAIVACGAVGSTGLLLRSATAFDGARTLDPSGVLGRRLSANGDYGVSGVVGPDYEHDVEGHKGKPMSSFCPTFFGAQRFILIPFYAAPLYLALGQPTSLVRAAKPTALGRRSTGVADGERDWGLAFKRRIQTFGSRFLTMGCLAIDDSEGEIRLAKDGVTPTVHWNETSRATEQRWSAAVLTMRKIYEALGGEMFLDSYRRDGTVNTAHPLGGCPMADDGVGIVDATCESITNENLFVVDGAVIPSALGVNPSMTIAAVAELVADRLVRGVGTKSLAERLS